VCRSECYSNMGFVRKPVVEARRSKGKMWLAQAKPSRRPYAYLHPRMGSSRMRECSKAGLR